MELSTLTAISPIDGRYRGKVASLAGYFSEFGLLRYRLLVEVEYFIALCDLGLPQLAGVEDGHFLALKKLYQQFDESHAKAIKDIEAVTNHDVKAVEYFLKQELEKMGLGHCQEFVHFGLTSQDINNTSIPYSLKLGLEQDLVPAFEGLVKALGQLASDWKDVPMLARTHGQPATPVRLGKEISVFVVRLQQQLDSLAALPFPGKFGGATGNFNAHHAAFPEFDWHQFAEDFLDDSLGLKRSHPTTQIDHYDGLAAIFDNLRRINVILIDLCRDMWTYVSMEYFRQKVVEGEVGSSAMPHKVNPIDFENAEGNLGVANSLLTHLAEKLPVSRLQRDLTDSTVLRNVGVPLAHSLLAVLSITKGLSKLKLNEAALQSDLTNNWLVVSEAIQTILRREGYPKPYEALKEFTRGHKPDAAGMAAFVESLDLTDEVKAELKALRPDTYLGPK